MSTTGSLYSDVLCMSLKWLLVESYAMSRDEGPESNPRSITLAGTTGLYIMLYKNRQEVQDQRPSSTSDNNKTRTSMIGCQVKLRLVTSGDRNQMSQEGNYHTSSSGHWMSPHRLAVAY